MTETYLNTHKGTKRDNGKRGSPNNALSGSSQEPSAYRSPTFTGPEEHSKMAGRNPNYRLSKRHTIRAVPELSQESLSPRVQTPNPSP